MDDPSSSDLEFIHAMLATMQQSSGQPYDDLDDDDDDDYDDDDEEDDDDELYYGEHNIQTMLNPYGEAAMAGAADPHLQMPNAQTMNFLQGLLNMNSSSLNGMAGIEAAIGESMGQMDAAGGSAAGFLPAMQSLLPNMGPEMAGALAGAFAGGMGALADYGHGGPHSNDDEYDEEDEDEDDEEVLSDDEDEEEDDDEEQEFHERHLEKMGGVDPAALALGGVGGLMAAGMVAAGASQTDSRYHAPPQRLPHDPRLMRSNYHESMSSPALMALGSSAMISKQPVSNPSMSMNSASSLPLIPGQSLSLMPVPTRPVASIPAPATLLPTPVASVPQPVTASSCGVPVVQSAPAVTVASTFKGSMSGGIVCKTDPLAALSSGIGAVALGASVLSPVVNNALGNSGGTAVLNKLDSSNGSTSTVIGNESFNSSNNTLSGNDINNVVTSLAMTKISSPSPENSPKGPIQITSTPVKLPPRDVPNNNVKMTDIEDDKASLGSGSSRSEASGGGKSDTESVGKKTPSPVPEGRETRHVQGGSYASIPDLASATESMRDSDTDNHSEAHNVTANLSDLDGDIHEQKTLAQNGCKVGPLPVVVERSTYGWGSMVGLDRAKEALKSLFLARSFPEVFEGTEGSCKGVLLFGPPRSGKTCLARALAKEADNSLFVGISSGYLLAHSPLDAIKLVRCMFDQARHEKPAIILFDEIEALCYHPYNESSIRAKDEILAQVKGFSTIPPAYPHRPDPAAINDGIMVLGTTNQPWLLEEKLRRVFAYNIHVKLPGEKPRHELFRMFLQNLPHDITEEQFNCLISKSESYSAADINTVIRQASHRVPLEPRNNSGIRMLTYDDVATVMTQYRCRYDDSLKLKYTQYIQSATHSTVGSEDGRDRKDKPRGVKRFSHRIAKSLAAAVLAVID